MERGGGRRLEAYYARGMLEIRTSLHLSIRLAVRANQALLPYGGAASEGAGPWRAALPAFVVLDLVVWQVLRRDDRFGLRWRLPMDALDAAFWVLSPRPVSGHYDWAVMVAAPLAVEAGVRLGWRGLVVPLVVGLTTSVAAVVAGKAIGFVGVAWIAVAVAVGVVFFQYCRGLDDRTEIERQGVVAAARRRAFLAGQNHVAMGASSAVDAIEGLVPVLGRPSPGSALWRLADGWKGDLRATTAQQAVYLQVALLEWEKHQNRHPDLAGLVEVRVDEGHGTTLLSAAQAVELRRALDERAPRGAVRVGLHEPDDAHLPGQALALDLDDECLVLAADRRLTVPPFDACFVAYLYVFMIELAGSVRDLGGAPPVSVFTGALICVLAGVVSHRRIRARGPAARTGVIVLGIAVALALTALSAFFRTPITAEGEPTLGFGPGLLVLCFIAGYYSWSLGRRQWALFAAMVGTVALGILVFPAPSAITVRAVIGSVAYNLFPYLPLRHLARALERAGDQHVADIGAIDEGTERAAFVDGGESVVGLVRQAREEALRQLDAVRPALDPPLADLATRRLEEVERRLQSLGPVAGSSS